MCLLVNEHGMAGDVECVKYQGAAGFQLGVLNFFPYHYRFLRNNNFDCVFNCTICLMRYFSFRVLNPWTLDWQLTYM